MRKTYVTKIEDKAGVFLTASRIIAGLGGNIVRVNYNKAVDIHTLFIEVEAGPEQHQEIAARLQENGFLGTEYDNRQILMIELKVPDEAGALVPALEVLNRHHISISYLSSREDGTPFQSLKMGILIENAGEIRQLLEELSVICELRIMDYEVTDRLLDGTVFYVTFANEMRDILQLSQKDANCVLIRANKLMQVLDEQNKSALQTFDYIRRFARFVQDHKGAAFDARFSTRELAEGLRLHVIEPPCGSNTSILEAGEELLLVDGGYPCYKNEMLALLREHFPDFDRRPKKALITHVDMDHTGLMDLADPVYMSRNSYEDLLLEEKGERGFREQNDRHMPYFALSEIITGYVPPAADAVSVIGGRGAEEGLLVPIGRVRFGRWNFDCYEGPGGHVKGEIIAVCEELKLIFSGDIFVNVKGITPEQKEFNRLAPFLLTGVDEDPALSKKCREYLVQKYSGYFCCPGHGPVMLLP